MSARTQTQRVVTLLLVLAFLVCSVPVFGVTASAADSETYLYNGVELTDINTVWTDKENFIFACIFPYMQSYRLYLCSVSCYVKVGEDIANLYKETVPCEYAQYDLTNGIWVYASGGTSTSNICFSVSHLPVIWSNKDILYEDGTVYLYASEPIVNNIVTGIEIESASWVPVGDWLLITPTVSGTGDFSTDCTCTVSGGTSSGTYVTVTEQDGVFNLHVGEDETAETLTVTVASVQDPSISASKTIIVVYVDTGGSDGEDTTPTESTTEDIEATEPVTESEQDIAGDQGNSSIDELTGVIPDYSEGFMDALSSFTSAMTYTGTDAKLTIPAVAFPALGSLVPGFQMMDETVVDFGEYVAMMPQNLMLLVQSLLTIALIVYCFKELYGTISYVLTLKGGNG